MIDFKHYIGG